MNAQLERVSVGVNKLCMQPFVALRMCKHALSCERPIVDKCIAQYWTVTPAIKVCW
jgi:hypothetical protein